MADMQVEELQSDNPNIMDETYKAYMDIANRKAGLEETDGKVRTFFSCLPLCLGVVGNLMYCQVASFWPKRPRLEFARWS